MSLSFSACESGPGYVTLEDDVIDGIPGEKGD